MGVLKSSPAPANPPISTQNSGSVWGPQLQSCRCCTFGARLINYFFLLISVLPALAVSQSLYPEPNYDGSYMIRDLRSSSSENYPDHHFLRLLAPTVADSAFRSPSSHAAASAAAAAAAAVRLSRRQSEQLPEAKSSTQQEPSCAELRAMWRHMKRMSRHSEITNEIPALPFLPQNAPGLKSAGGYGFVLRKNPNSKSSYTIPINGNFVQMMPSAKSQKIGKVYFKSADGLNGNMRNPVIVTEVGGIPGMVPGSFEDFTDENAYRLSKPGKDRYRVPDYERPVGKYLGFRRNPTTDAGSVRQSPPGDFMEGPLSAKSLGGVFGTVVKSPEEKAMWMGKSKDSKESSERGTGQRRDGMGTFGASNGKDESDGVFGRFASMEVANDDRELTGQSGYSGSSPRWSNGRGSRRKSSPYGSMVHSPPEDSMEIADTMGMGRARLSRGGKDERCHRIQGKQCSSDEDCFCYGDNRLRCTAGVVFPNGSGPRYRKCVSYAQSKKVSSMDDWGTWHTSPMDVPQLGLVRLRDKRQSDRIVFPSFPFLTSFEQDEPQPIAGPITKAEAYRWWRQLQNEIENRIENRIENNFP